jgi:large subunit ribosomal protein L29
MASKKFIELQNMAIEDLQTELQNAVNSYRKLKFDHSIKGLPNPLELRSARKEVARMKTEIRRRELSAMTPEELSKRNNIVRRRRNS